MNFLGRPSLRPIDRARHRLWAINLLAMAKTAEAEGRVPPAPLRAKAFRANPLWLERAMRADSMGYLLPSAYRPQSFVGILRNGADPTQCYERVEPHLIERRDSSTESHQTPSRRGPMKGRLYDRATFNLVDLGEILLPGSRKVMDADLWSLLQETPRSLYDTHIAVEKLLRQLDLVRVPHAQIKAIESNRLKKLREPMVAGGYPTQLKQLHDNHPTFDIDVLSLFANLVHEAYLMGNRELHELHLLAFVSHYKKLASLNIDHQVVNSLSFDIQRKIINQDWWHAGYLRTFPPIDTLQLLLGKRDWDALKRERTNLAQTTGWLRVHLEP